MSCFITVEGVDGAGKSIHLERLAQFLTQKGKEVVLTREPGGTPLGEKLRALLLHESMTPTTEALLMFASRQENIDSIIKPALRQGKIVICDRFTDSSLAYQGAGRAYSMERLLQLAEWIHGDLHPTITFLFDLPIEQARERLRKTRECDRFEQEEEAFFSRVREKYLQLARDNSQRFVVLDSSQRIEEIWEVIKTTIEKRLSL